MDIIGLGSDEAVKQDVSKDTKVEDLILEFNTGGAIDFNIVLAYTDDAVRYYLDANGIEYHTVEGSVGFCSEIMPVDSNAIEFLIGIEKSHEGEFDETLTLVHELSHCVTFIMENTGIEDDEFRSYMLEFLYKRAVVWLIDMQELTK